MKTYLEIQVPLRYNASWFQELRLACRNIDVRWQMAYHHITMAFVDETPENIDIRPLLEKHLNAFPAPTLTFDKLDVFTAMSGMHIIYLTATDVPQSFLSLIENIRSDMKTAGCVVDSWFRLHVTLGRVKDPHIQLATIQELMESVSLPAFSLTLEDVDYRIFRGKTLYETKLISQK
jgi:2'-5' RNA ligase